MFRNKPLLLFLIGCFSMTQIHVVGFIGISELVMMPIAPFVYARNHALLRRQGFSTLLTLLFLWGASALATDLYRSNSIPNLLKGFAGIYSLFAGMVCIHALLWDDLRRFRWILLGLFASSIISIFIFQPGTSVADAAAMGTTAKEAAVGYKLFWMAKIIGTLLLPITIIYLRIPTLVSVSILGLCAMVALFQGGRSAFLIMVFSTFLVALGRQRQDSMRTIRRAFPLVAVLMVLLSFGAKFTYEYVVTHGYMGENELKKYEKQHESRLGLLSGRNEFLPALLAIRDSPLLGYGSWSLDTFGYTRMAWEILGEDDEIKAYDSEESSGRRHLMPGHSRVWGTWVSHGLAGAVFWLYIFFLYVRVLIRDMHVAPMLFGYLAIMLPAEFWNIWFSGFADRVGVGLLLTICLLVDNARRQAQRAVNPWA